jgi:hypothetical protein
LEHSQLIEIKQVFLLLLIDDRERILVKKSFKKINKNHFNDVKYRSLLFTIFTAGELLILLIFEKYKKDTTLRKAQL